LVTLSSPAAERGDLKNGSKSNDKKIKDKGSFTLFAAKRERGASSEAQTGWVVYLAIFYYAFIKLPNKINIIPL